MCLKEARPAVPPASLRGLYFEQLAREDIKVVCIEILTRDSFGFKTNLSVARTKLSVANHLTFNSDVHNSFCRNGRSNRLTELQNAGGGHAD